MTEKNFPAGNFVKLREIKESDASFVLDLRCNQAKATFLHKTDYDIDKQIEYIRNVQKKIDEYYFIIENKKNEKIGTYRIYDLKEESFCIGSWLMVNEVTPEEVMEADYLVRKFGFEELGFEKCHFDVRKDNKKVVNYHKLMGAVQVDENDLDYFFECTKESYYSAIKRFM